MQLHLIQDDVEVVQCSEHISSRRRRSHAETIHQPFPSCHWITQAFGADDDRRLFHSLVDWHVLVGRNVVEISLQSCIYVVVEKRHDWTECTCHLGVQKHLPFLRGPQIQQLLASGL